MIENILKLINIASREFKYHILSMSCTNCSLIFDDMTPRTKCIVCENQLCISCVIHEIDICRLCYHYQDRKQKEKKETSKKNKTRNPSDNHTKDLVQQLEGIYNMIRNGIDVDHRFQNKILVIPKRFNIEIIQTKKAFQAKYCGHSFYWGPTTGYMNNLFSLEKIRNIYNYINNVDTFYEICKNKQIEALRQSIPNSILVRMDKNLFTLIRNFL